MIDNLPKLITDEKRTEMDNTLTIDEVNDVVFSLNKDSVSGSDSFSGEFFQSYWDIIGKDIFTVIVTFFYGMKIPR